MPHRRIPIPFPAALAVLCLCACARGPRGGGAPAPEGGGGAVLGSGKAIAAGADTVLAERSGPGADRAAFGRNADPPFWSPLTPPEARALRGRDRAAAGDPQALLDLAILASGDRRESADYAAIRARVAEFTARMRPALAAEKDARKRGDMLHRAMHAAFFPRNAGDAGTFATGYDWGQSRLTGIFDDMRFNCISSALLFVVLAREHGFDARGVVLPSHTFVQLALPGGQIVEVETTSPEGYGAVHDEAFYRNRGRGWFSSRGLPASTYRDYLDRKIVSPLQLVAFNMANQHTGSDRMDLKDRRRLFEARAWIDPGSRDAASNRLAFLSAEYKALSARDDWKTLDRLYGRMADGLPSLRRAWDADAVLANHIAWLPFCHANTLHRLGRNEESFPRIDSSLVWLRPDAPEGAILKSNNVSLLILITRDMAGRGAYAQAEARLLRYPALLREDANLRSHMTWINQEHAMLAWKRQDWQAAADLFIKSLKYSPEEYRKPIQENLAAAYFNMSVNFRNRGQESKADAILEKCQAEIPQAARCRE